MSLATRQSMTLISVIGGCLQRIDKSNLFAVVQMKEMVRDTCVIVKYIQDKWPTTGDQNKDVKWSLDKVDIWGEHVKTVKRFYSLTVFIVVCLRCLEDLKTQIRDKEKLELLSMLDVPLERMFKFVDPNNDNIPAHEKSGELMDELYKLIQWEWKKQKRKE